MYLLSFIICEISSYAYCSSYSVEVGILKIIVMRFCPAFLQIGVRATFY